MAKIYVPIFLDWLDNTQDLSAEEKGHLIDAIIMYASGSDGWADQLQTSGEKIAFRFMRGQVDRNLEISAARSKAGSSKAEQKETKGSKPEQKEEKQDKEQAKRFIPPTLEEVKAYCTERENSIDPEQFVAYYANRDWKLGKGTKMKDWKLAVITWEKNERGNGNGKGRADQNSQGTIRGDYSFLRQV